MRASITGPDHNPATNAHEPTPATLFNKVPKQFETFSDANKLLAECERRGIEGIVSKRTDAPYRSGKCD